MIRHKDFKDSFEGKKQLHFLINTAEITLAGNARLRIYGHLDCRTGKRMHRKNRVFFKNEEEAINSGYRPCGHCMHNRYESWKFGIAKLRHK